MPEQSAGLWELIERNRRQSAALVLTMGVLLVSTGAAMGYGVALQPEGATIGAIAAFVIFVILTFAAFYSGDKAVLAIAGAKEVTHKEYPQLWNVSEEMSIAAGMPMPRLYIIDSDVPNAFATGRKPDKAAIAVTRGLMERLTRDELQGVIAHEMSHVRHRDTTYMTVVVVMLGTILLLADLYLRAVWYGGGRSRSRRSGKGAGGRPDEKKKLKKAPEREAAPADRAPAPGTPPSAPVRENGGLDLCWSGLMSVLQQAGSIFISG